MSTNSVLCKVLVEFSMKDRSVSLVSMSDGQIGILVKDEHGSPVIPLEPDFPGMTFAHAPLIVKTAMVFMVMSAKSDPESLIRCLHTAVIMANGNGPEQQFELLESICGVETANYVISQGWGVANKLAEKVFQGASETELKQLCALHFPDEVLSGTQTLQ